MQAVGNTFIKLSSITLLALSVNLVGCQTFKNLTGAKDGEAVEILCIYTMLVKGRTNCVCKEKDCYEDAN